jgi:hypothetical protein
MRKIKVYRKPISSGLSEPWSVIGKTRVWFFPTWQEAIEFALAIAGYGYGRAAE